MSDGYIRRHVDSRLEELMDALPALMITGPRACGKTTTAARLAESLIRLDDPAQADAFTTSPDAFIATAKRPVLIDEWQEVPSSLGAVKRSVDLDYSPGQFVLTGSVRSRFLADSWPGTGRVTPVSMWGLTQAEILGRYDIGLDWLWKPETLTSGMMADAPNILDYVMLAMAGVLPEVYRLDDPVRVLWYEGYVDQLIHHDAASISAIRTPLRLKQLLNAVAVNSAGLVSVASLAQAARVDQRTAASYLDSLEDMRVLQRAQPWFRNHLKRMMKTPKYYLTDPGLMARLHHVDPVSVRRDGGLMGRLVDTFVAAQLRPLLDLMHPRATMFHLRDGGGHHEIDIVLDRSSSGVVAAEIKSAASVTPRDAKHLAWLRDQIPDEFVAGYVFHTGPATFPLGDKLWALPISTLWRV